VENSTIFMHQTTYDYILRKINRGDYTHEFKVFYSGNQFDFAGYRIVITDTVSPTIMEPDWVFPKEKFVKYEESDISWCRFFGIGRPGIQQVGEIITMNHDLEKNIGSYIRR
jgi:hypothetical protein